MDAGNRATWRRWVFSKWGGFCHDHAGLVALVVLGITIFFGYFAATIEINLGFLSLLDENDPLVKRVNYANENFGGLDYLNIALVTPEDQPVDKDLLIEYANHLAPMLAARTDLVNRVVYKVDLEAMIRWAPLFLEGDDLDDFIRTSREQQEDFSRLFADTRLVPFVTEMNSILEREIIEEDEISDEKDAKRQLEALGEFYDTAWKYMQTGQALEAGPAKRSVRNLLLPSGDDDSLDEDYFFFDDGRMLMMRMMPAQPGDDYIFCQKALAAIEKQIDEVSAKVPGVEVFLAGNMHVMRDEHNAIVYDMRMTTLLSMALVLVIFIVVFRKFSDLILIGVCLAMGLAITFGLTKFVIGYLSLLTAFFGAIMIGLGIDFAIHIISRYGENIRAGHAVRDSIVGALTGSGPGILTGGVTTASAFLVLMIARFKGLSQLGFVSGAGILVMMLLMFTLLPALICLRDRKKVAAELTVKSMGDSLPLGKLADLAMHRPKTAMTIVLVLLFVAGFGISQTRFNYDYRSLEPRNSVAMKHIDEVEKRLGKGIDYGMILTDTVEESRLLAAKVEKLSTVKEVESISDFIPENQMAKNEKLRGLADVFGPMTAKRKPGEGDAFQTGALNEFATAARGSSRVVRAVLQLAILGGQFELEDSARDVAARIDRFAEKAEAEKTDRAALGATRFQGFVSGELVHLLASLKQSAKGETLTADRLPQAVKDNFVGNDGRFALYSYPKGNIWHELYMKKHNAELKSVDDSVVSVAILFEEVVNNIKVDFKSSVWFSLAAVFLLVLSDFRKFRTAVLALIPLLVGSVWMVGIMPLIGMQFNLVNVAIVPLILGIGIDNGVHILHRFRMEKERRVHNAVEHTGKAILLSSLTTMAGFGMLGLATYIAIGTLGQLLVIGVGFCFLTSVFVLPMILARFEKWGWKV